MFSIYNHMASVMLAPIGFVIAININAAEKRPALLHAIFSGFAAAVGVLLSIIFLVFDPLNIVQAFTATAAGFAAPSLYSFFRRRDPERSPHLPGNGVVRLILAYGINLLVHSGHLGMMISIGGGLLFAGLTVVDTQKTRDAYLRVAGTRNEPRAVIMAALTLYMAFIIMFLMC